MRRLITTATARSTRPAPHWIASSLPQLAVAHPAFLGLEIPDSLLQWGRHFTCDGAQARPPVCQCLFTLTSPRASSRSTSYCSFRQARLPPPPPDGSRGQHRARGHAEVWPVEHFDRVGKMLIGLGFDPFGSVAKHDLLVRLLMEAA